MLQPMGSKRVGHNPATEQVYLQSPAPGTVLVSALLAVPLSFLILLWEDKMYTTEATPSLPADDLPSLPLTFSYKAGARA